MAPSINHLFISLLTVLIVATTATAREVKNFDDVKVPVDQVCSRTKNPGFCKGVLRGTEQQSLVTVSRSLLNQAMVKATDIYTQISSLVRKAPVDQKGPLNYCMAGYNSAINDIETSGDYFVYMDYVNLNKISVRIANYANKCEGSFGKSPSDPSPLTQQNSDFFNLVDVLTATSYLLSH